MAYELKPGMAVSELDTPALLLDLDAFERNLETMAGFFAGRPAVLRPHSKTHKCPEIARRQIAAGAIGITCAKVSEAEVMVTGGIQDILIANQVTGPIKIDRLTDLASRCDLMVAVDDPRNVAELAQACKAKHVSLRVLIEIEIGMGRCGVDPGQPALALAQAVVDAPHLEFKGLMGYEGHLVMVPDPEERAAKVREAFAPLAETADLLCSAGLPVEIVSGGGTGSFDITGDFPFVTEIQAGSYVFMDTTYRKIRSEFVPALTMMTSVVSRGPGRVVVDAGLKAMSSEFGPPHVLDGEGVSVRYLSEEHGVLDVASPELVSWQPGERVYFLPSHCCTTVNLNRMLHVVRDNKLVDLWPVAASGCAQ